MPLRDLAIEVPIGGLLTPTKFNSIPIRGILTSATAQPAAGGVPQTYSRLILADPVNDRRITLTEGWPSWYNTSRPIMWSGNMQIAKDYSYYVFANIRNLTGVAQKWKLSVNYTEGDEKHG